MSDPTPKTEHVPFYLQYTGEDLHEISEIMRDPDERKLWNQKQAERKARRLPKTFMTKAMTKLKRRFPQFAESALFVSHATVPEWRDAVRKFNTYIRKRHQLSLPWGPNPALVVPETKLFKPYGDALSALLQSHREARRKALEQEDRDLDAQLLSHYVNELIDGDRQRRQAQCQFMYTEMMRMQAHRLDEERKAHAQQEEQKAQQEEQRAQKAREERWPRPTTEDERERAIQHERERTRLHRLQQERTRRERSRLARENYAEERRAISEQDRREHEQRRLGDEPEEPRMLRQIRLDEIRLQERLDRLGKTD